MGDPQCTCADGPLPECDLHGLPSAAYWKGWDDALRQAGDVLQAMRERPTRVVGESRG